MNTAPTTPLSWVLWIDADALPNMLRDFIIKTTLRRQIVTHFVANTNFLALPPSAHLRWTTVEKKADAADRYILSHATPNDIIVTQDIELAGQLIKLYPTMTIITPHGELLTANNISLRLANRDLLTILRASGLDESKQQRSFSEKQKRAFANILDQLLSKRLKV